MSEHFYNTNNLNEEPMSLPHVLCDQCKRKAATIFGWIGGLIAILITVKTDLFGDELSNSVMFVFFTSFVFWIFGFLVGVISLNNKEK